MLYIFVTKFPCCRKIREALVIYGLKRYLIIYPYAANRVITILLAALSKQAMNNYLLWRNSFYGSCRSEPFARRNFAKRWSEKFCKFNVKHLCWSLFFNKAGGYYAKTPFLWNMSWRLLLSKILLKSYLKSFWKIPKKTPLKKSSFNEVVDSRPKTL